LKGSKNISTPATKASAAPSSSAVKSPPSSAVDGFALTGVTDLPDPATNAYRKDLADIALAGRVIASHYAEPLVRHLVAAAPLLATPANDAEPVAQLAAGDELQMLDLSLGWAWGYGPDGRVGYVSADAVGA
jgi:Bacterial dipeptidyl-peptidase Sh3 domain